MVNNLRLFNILIYVTFLLFSNISLAQEPFTIWLNGLRQDALADGVSEKTVTATISHVALMPNIIKLDLAQPEFVSPFFDYYYQRVGAVKISRGQALLVKYESLLNQIEAQYGVPKALLLSFWGMETNYGSYQGDIDTLSALATLAYDGRRAKFFRSQLLNAMHMIDMGNADVNEFHGSWAGAFGNMQFMPSTFITYAVDGDGDEQIDIVNSMPDAFASAANYLSQVGWRKGEPAMIEVQLPENFQWQQAQLNLRKPTDEWARQGVTALQANNSKVEIKLAPIAASFKSAKLSNKKASETIKSPSEKDMAKPLYQNKLIKNSVSNTPPISVALPQTNSLAAILLPQGWRGPAFMVFDNFDAIMDWNRSVNYALSVAQLAKCIEGEPRIFGGLLAEKGALTFKELHSLQSILNERGFDVGVPDGFPGLRTQAAVRTYQQTQQLPADGYASPSLYNLLQTRQ